MRAKQLEGLGIDEKDISDVSVPVRQKQELLPAATDSVQSPTVSTINQSAPPSTGGNTQPPTAGDKDKKGAAFAVYHRELRLSVTCYLPWFAGNAETAKSYQFS